MHFLNMERPMTIRRAARLVSSISLAALASASTLVPQAAAAEEVNLYTTREPGLINPLLEDFTAKTKIKINTVFVKDGLAERVAAEGDRSPADVLMTVDFGNMLDVVDKGVTQPITSEVLNKAVPAHLRGPNGEWFALSLRARIVYAKAGAPITAITYEELADPKFKGKICIRSGKHPYNTALIAAYIAHHGEQKAEQWLRGVKANLARKPAGGDREGARDILGGICEIAVGNSYYVGLMRSGVGGPEQKIWGEAIKTILPTFAGAGTHVNASGASIARNAPNKANAIKLLEFLVSPEAQDIYARGNFEFPINATAKVDPIIANLGTLKSDGVSLGEITKYRKLAANLVDKVGFDN
jgi:iron(III) transport system substrate-binding protein